MHYNPNTKLHVNPTQHDMHYNPNTKSIPSMAQFTDFNFHVKNKVLLKLLRNHEHTYVFFFHFQFVLALSQYAICSAQGYHFDTDLTQMSITQWTPASLDSVLHKILYFPHVKNYQPSNPPFPLIKELQVKEVFYVWQLIPFHALYKRIYFLPQVKTNLK